MLPREHDCYKRFENMQTDKHHRLNVDRKAIRIFGDASRVITRLHLPDDKKRILNIIRRVLCLSEPAANKLKEQIEIDFLARHEDIGHIFERNLHEVEDYIPPDVTLSVVQKYLIGSYFTKEYAIESAALFNPSIVPHPDQSNLRKGSLRFVMSLRATGEGHISSIVFRSGILDRKNKLTLDKVSDFVETPGLLLDSVFNRNLFRRKLDEMGAINEISAHILNQLPEEFTYYELLITINQLREQLLFRESLQNSIFEVMRWLADSNYEVEFHADHPISERVIFPVSQNESRGIEDARFVKFIDNSREMLYYATYTAYNGSTILPQLIETKDFIKFNILTLNGKAVQNKGMALFPRKINDNYVMLSRQDGENNHIMFSDNIHFWQTSQIIQEPKYPWEFVQIGNCGSPLETDKGWIVLTHGVGPMRSYCIGAILLDLDNPTKIIARLDEPLLAPYAKEREGYVPNVVYSCGAIIHNRDLVIPYAMADISSSVATVNINDLINRMRTID